MKQCRRCKQVKPLDQFSDKPRTRDGKWQLCKDCQAQSRLPWNKKVTMVSRGFVYLIRAENGLVKIGMTSNFNLRICNLRAQSPIGITVLFSAEVLNMNSTEHILHTMFQHLYSHGEWFRLTQQDIETARDIIKQTMI